MYPTPADIDAFDKHYFETHLPLADAVPGLDGTRVTRFHPGSDGTPALYHLMSQFEFADADAMVSALSSKQGRALSADVANLGVTPLMLTGETP